MKQHFWTLDARRFILVMILVALWGFAVGVTAMYHHFIAGL
jgi:hypothetical protein